MRDMTTVKAFSFNDACIERLTYSKITIKLASNVVFSFICLVGSELEIYDQEL
jgi:hypothetical protein